MKENYIYPIKIKEEDGIFLITFPDQVTDAVDESEVTHSAQEVLSLCIIENENQGNKNPEPSKEKNINFSAVLVNGLKQELGIEEKRK